MLVFVSDCRFVPTFPRLEKRWKRRDRLDSGQNGERPRDAMPARRAALSRSGLACALFAACALASVPAAGGSAPAFVASRGVVFPSVPERLIGSSHATLRVQLSAPGVVYYLATPQDDAGAVADAADDGPHVVIANITTDERRAVPTPEEVRLGVLAFLNDTDSDPSNDSDDAYAFGRGALAAGTLAVTAANVVFSVNVSGLNPQSHNDLWVVAANASGAHAALQTHVALLAFRARKLPPGFRDVAGEGGAPTPTPALHIGATAASVAAALDEPGNVYLVVQSASAQALTSAQVRAKAAANESGACFADVPSANVEHVVPVRCSVFNLSSASSYAAYFVVEGLGLTFGTHGERPLSAAPFVWQFITADDAAPRGAAAAANATRDGFELSATSTKNGAAFFVVVEAGAETPSFREVARGVGANGSVPVAMGTFAVTGVGGNVTGAEAAAASAPANAASGSITIAGLKSVTAHDAHVVVVDAGAFYLAADASADRSDPDTEAVARAVDEAAAPRNVNATVLSVWNVTTST